MTCLLPHAILCLQPIYLPVNAHAHAKGHGQRSAGSKDRMGTDEADCIRPAFRANEVGK